MSLPSRNDYGVCMKEVLRSPCGPLALAAEQFACSRRMKNIPGGVRKCPGAQLTASTE